MEQANEGPVAGTQWEHGSPKRKWNSQECDVGVGAWTVFGVLKLFLKLIDEGPQALVTGILFAMVPSPGNDLLDIGETVYQIFNLDGTPSGTVRLSDKQRVQFAQLALLNRKQLDQAVTELDFPALAKKEFARMTPPSFEKREMASMRQPEFRERHFPERPA